MWGRMANTVSIMGRDEDCRSEVSNVTEVDNVAGATLVKIAIFSVNPVTKTGQRMYMMHMLLLPFLPITALIMQNSIAMGDLLTYQREVATIGSKVSRLLSYVQVDGITLLEKFITNLQKERAEVAFHIFTNGSKNLEMNLTTR